VLNIAKKCWSKYAIHRFTTRMLLSVLAVSGLSLQAAAPNWINYNFYPFPNETPLGLTVGPGDLLWSAIPGNLVSVNTSGVITTYPMPPNYGPLSLTLGPDGALWFVQHQYGIGRFSPSTGFTEYAVPTVGSDGVVDLLSITNGPDGALWFTQGAFCEDVCIGPNVGRVTTSGVVTMFPVTGGAQSITAGPDGALWFTGGEANIIGRITTDGVVTTYPLPTPSRNPQSIVAGLDGALWFVELGAGGRVGRMTTSGELSEIPLFPNGEVRLLTGSSIVLGSDGALWFSMETNLSSTSVLWRVTMHGTVTAYRTSFGGQLELSSGTVGPDKALWFADGDVGFMRFPACGLGLTATFSGSTLNLNFDLGSNVATTWQSGFYYDTNEFQAMWSKPLGPVVPPSKFTVPAGPGFPSIGYIAPMSVLRDASTSEALCAEWQIVNTGGSGAVDAEGVARSVMNLFQK
jgi:virginiamycin B lyase